MDFPEYWGPDGVDYRFFPGTLEVGSNTIVEILEHEATAYKELMSNISNPEDIVTTDDNLNLIRRYLTASLLTKYVYNTDILEDPLDEESSNIAISQIFDIYRGLLESYKGNNSFIQRQLTNLLSRRIDLNLTLIPNLNPSAISILKFPGSLEIQHSTRIEILRDESAIVDKIVDSFTDNSNHSYELALSLAQQFLLSQVNTYFGDDYSFIKDSFDMSSDVAMTESFQLARSLLASYEGNQAFLIRFLLSKADFYDESIPYDEETGIGVRSEPEVSNSINNLIKVIEKATQEK